MNLKHTAALTSATLLYDSAQTKIKRPVPSCTAGGYAVVGSWIGRNRMLQVSFPRGYYCIPTSSRSEGDIMHWIGLSASAAVCLEAMHRC